jgi:hypothetical protein
LNWPKFNLGRLWDRIANKKTAGDLAVGVVFSEAVVPNRMCSDPVVFPESPRKFPAVENCDPDTTSEFVTQYS